EDVESAESLLDLVHHRFDLIRFGHVAIDHQWIPQFGCDLFRIGFVCSCGISNEIDDTLGAACAEGFDHRGPETARTAGHEHDLVGEIKWVRHELDRINRIYRITNGRLVSSKLNPVNPVNPV